MVLESGDAQDRRASKQIPPLRILYALGPGDVVGLYRDLEAGREPAFQMSMPFSGQFLDWCDEAKAEAHVMSWHGRADSIEVGPHWLENRPKLSWYFRGGLKYHFGVVAYGLTVVARAVRGRAMLVIADSGTTHWIVLSLLALARIPVIAVLHNTLWPMGYPPQRTMDRLLLAMDGWFFRHIAAATVCVSPECERQVRLAARTPKGPVTQCRAQFREGFLSRVAPPADLPARPFRVLFMGRIEETKGVFLILQMAERLEQEMPGAFRWRIVGAGSAFETLQRQAKERQLNQTVSIETSLRNREKALETLGWAHAMVVPTTSQFSEGLAMTAAEAVLAGRPVVVSSVVPAWEVLGCAAIKAEADNVDSFVEAFRKLALDPAYYDACRRARTSVQAQFYDRSQGLGNALGRAITTLFRGL